MAELRGGKLRMASVDRRVWIFCNEIWRSRVGAKQRLQEHRGTAGGQVVAGPCQ